MYDKSSNVWQIGRLLVAIKCKAFGLKKLSAIHERIAYNLQACVDGGNVPEWMTVGRTVLIMKDETKGTVASNYRPIACLPLMWKLLTGIFSEKVYIHLQENQVLPDEQKGCRKIQRDERPAHDR